jgi:hypothetical protein
MHALSEVDDRDVLEGWVADRGRGQRVAESPGVVVPGAGFAFYGRTSTAEFQDPVTSRAWQREMAATLVVGHGTITAEFFDVGVSRRVVWERRPQAAALLEQAQGADRTFDAVVVGEYERAFTDRQFEQVARLLQRAGVLVWLPEAGGPVDLGSPTHRVLMRVLAAQSQREVVRCRHLTMAGPLRRSSRADSSAAARPTGITTVAGQPAVSKGITHPALVTETHFVAAQQVCAERAASGGRKRRLLAGLLRCGHCGRRMDAHWVHHRAGYRCRHGNRSTTSRPADAPESLYLREDDILRRIAARIARDIGPRERPGSAEEVISILRSNAVVVEVYGPATGALTTLG